MKVYVNGILYDTEKHGIAVICDNEDWNSGRTTVDYPLKLSSGEETAVYYGPAASTDDALDFLQDAFDAQDRPFIPNTKNTSTCLQRAGDTEPIFVIRAKDPIGTEAIAAWITKANNQPGLHEPEKIHQAVEIIQQMNDWRAKNKK